MLDFILIDIYETNYKNYLTKLLTKQIKVSDQKNETTNKKLMKTFEKNKNPTNDIK